MDCSNSSNSRTSTKLASPNNSRCNSSNSSNSVFFPPTTKTITLPELKTSTPQVATNSKHQEIIITKATPSHLEATTLSLVISEGLQTTDNLTEVATVSKTKIRAIKTKIRAFKTDMVAANH